MATKKLGSVKAVDTLLITSVNLASEVTGTTPVGNGGTGQTSYTNGQLLIGNTTGNTLAKATLTGTADQLIVTNGTGTITLSLPQSIATASTPQFARLGLGNVANATDPLAITGALRILSGGSFVAGVGRLYVTATQGLVITAGTGSAYDLLFANRAGGTIMRLTAASSLFEFNTAGDTIISGNNGAIATNATEGFIFIPKCAGTPTGVPTNASFPYIPMVYDSTNNKIFFYNGSWRGVTVT